MSDKQSPDHCASSCDLHPLRGHYAELLKKYGDSPQAAQQSDRATQERRMEILAQVGDIKKAKILDFGCATGHLLVYLKEVFGYEGEYVGYDLVPEMVAMAQANHPAGRFEVRDILREGIGEDFDYVFISGTFNNAVRDNWSWIKASLSLLYASSRIAVAFNNLSTYVDFREEGLFYVDPEEVFVFCKESLSPLVTLRHDYCVKDGVVPYEFTTYVYRSELLPRCRLSA